MNCTCCQQPLTGGLDTYGDVGQEMCWDCWSELVFEPADPYLDLRKLIASEFVETIAVEPDESEKLL